MGAKECNFSNLFYNRFTVISIKAAAALSIQNPKPKIQNRNGGGVWESNPPELALTISLTVLKTAPFTGTVSPPK